MTFGIHEHKPAAIGVAALSLLHAAPSYAYLDPGTGSIILQSILAGIAVAVGFLRFYWQRFKTFLASLVGNTADRQDDSTARHDAEAND